MILKLQLGHSLEKPRWRARRSPALRALPFGHGALSAPQPAPAESLLPRRRRRRRRPSRSLRRRVIAAPVPFVIVRAGKRVRRSERRVVFPLLRSRYRVLRVLRRTAGSVRPVAGFSRRGGGGRGLSGVSDAEDSGRGRGLRKCGGVKEGVGGERGGRRDRGEGGRRLCSDGGGTGGGEGEEALRSQRHLPETGG